MTNSARTLFLLGSAGLILGSLLPWASVTSPFIGTVSVTGIQGDGVFTLIGGALFLILGLTKKPAPGKVFSIVGGLIGIALFVLAFSKVGLFGDVEVGEAYGSIGSGLWITILGAALSTIGGFMKSPL